MMAFSCEKDATKTENENAGRFITTLKKRVFVVNKADE